MIALYITFNEQTYPRCRGHACDDHIETYTYVTQATEEFCKVANPLIEKIDALATKRNNEACEEWQKNNPNETECLCEGDEFLGLKWLEHSRHAQPQSHELTRHDEILTNLRSLLAELEEGV